MSETDVTADPRHSIGANRPKIEVLTRDELVEDHRALLAELDGLRLRKDSLPAVLDNDEQQATVAAFGKDVNDFLKRVDDTRKDTKGPYGDIVDAIDGFFNGDLRNVATPLKTHASKISGVYIDLKDRRLREKLAQEAKAAREAEEARLAAAAAAEAAGRNTEAETVLRQAEAQSNIADRAEARTQAPGVTLGRTYSSAGTTFGSKKEVIAIDRAAVDLEALRSYLKTDVLEAAVRARRVIDKSDIKGVTITMETKGNFR